MASLNDLATDVFTITNRPDLVVETRAALKKAIRKFHGADTFKRDLKTIRLDMTAQTPTEPNQYRWAIDLATNFPLWRRFKAIQYPPGLTALISVPAPLIDYPIGFITDRMYQEVAPDNLFDSYGWERPNYFYIQGSVVMVKSGWYIDFLDFTYYQWPTIPALPTDPLTSWIVNEYPDAITEEAAGQVFKMIGKDDEYQRFAGLFQENLTIVRTSDIGEVA